MSASVNLPLHHKVQKFSSGTASTGWSWKKGLKMVVVWMVLQTSSSQVALLNDVATKLCIFLIVF